MNNAKVAMETLKEEVVIDTTPWTNQRIQSLTNQLEAIQAISASSHWKLLEKEIFSGLVEAINRKLQIEKDDKEIARLQGQVVWANKFADIKKLGDIIKEELTRLNQNSNGKK